jgi:transposase-like protein
MFGYKWAVAELRTAQPGRLLKGPPWRVDETGEKMRRKSIYRYRAGGRGGGTEDVLSTQRNVIAANEFFRETIKSLGPLPISGIPSYRA